MLRGPGYQAGGRCGLTQIPTPPRGLPRAEVTQGSLISLSLWAWQGRKKKKDNSIPMSPGRLGMLGIGARRWPHLAWHRGPGA